MHIKEKQHGGALYLPGDPELHVYKTDGSLPAPVHQVQLAVPTPPLGGQDLTAPLLQKLRRGPLAPVSGRPGSAHVRLASHFFKKLLRWAGQGPYRSSIS